MKIKFTYGDVYGEPANIFRDNLYKKIGIEKLFKNKNLLDLGCGYGIDTLNFNKFTNTITGVDIEIPKKSKKHKGIRFVKSYAESLPFKNGEFSAVYMKDLLHHVKDVDKTLSELKRVTKQNSNIVILEGNRYNPIFYLLVTKLKGHEHFTQSEFKNKILKYFKNAKFSSFEIYPPFFFNKKQYLMISMISNLIERFKIFSPIFSYNVAIIKKDDLK